MKTENDGKRLVSAGHFFTTISVCGGGGGGEKTEEASPKTQHCIT